MREMKHKNPKENQINNPNYLFLEALTKSQKLDRRGFLRLNPPLAVFAKAYVGEDSWQEIALRNISLSGVSFSTNVGVKINLKSPLKIEICNQEKIIFRGEV